MQNEKENKNLVDEVGETNIYPVSEMEGASDDAKIHSEASLGESDKNESDEKEENN